MNRIVPALMALIFWPLPAQADLEVRVDKASQRMFVSVDGEMRHSWIVSTGLGGGPHDGTYRPQRLERKWHSRKYNMAPMPYSIFFDGNYAIHGTTHVRQLGRRASKGCVRLHPDNAAVLFALVRTHGADNTRIIIERVGATNMAAKPAQHLAAETGADIRRNFEGAGD
ncbi:MAG: L,D-transpeptidase [Pseudorhodoplanes sp.]|nr:L,D-transpeptidase [Pseudorhodoplanes sp.]